MTDQSDTFAREPLARHGVLPLRALRLVAVDDEPPQLGRLRATTLGLMLVVSLVGTIRMVIGLYVGSFAWVVPVVAMFATGGMMRWLSTRVADDRSEGCARGLAMLGLLGACAYAAAMLSALTGGTVALLLGLPEASLVGAILAAVAALVAVLLGRASALACATPVRDWCRGYRVVAGPVPPGTADERETGSRPAPRPIPPASEPQPTRLSSAPVMTAVSTTARSAPAPRELRGETRSSLPQPVTAGRLNQQPPTPIPVPPGSITPARDPLQGVCLLVRVTWMLAVLSLAATLLGLLVGASPSLLGILLTLGFAALQVCLAVRLRDAQSESARIALGVAAVLASLFDVFATFAIIPMHHDVSRHGDAGLQALMTIALLGSATTTAMQVWAAVLAFGRDAVAWASPACPRCASFVPHRADACPRCGHHLAVTA